MLDITPWVTGITQQVNVSPQATQRDETTALRLGARIEPQQFKNLLLTTRPHEA